MLASLRAGWLNPLFNDAMQLIGPEHVGLGSDFDDGGTAIADATAVSRITEALLARGYGETAVRGILGLNFLRVLREVMGG